MLLVGVTNPKIAVFFVAFLPQFVDPHRAGAPQVLILGGTYVALALLVDLLVASAAGTIGGWVTRRPSLSDRTRYVSGSVYLALGAAAAVGPNRGQQLLLLGIIP